ncbi:MAG TPA: hypothetical protein VGS19_22560 [Streptosporangiaceae bacterium]|nr:hypothetical protein [Streptosporangiaceae bacterium]
MDSLLDDVSPDARCLLDIVVDAWVRAEQWPIRQYVAHEIAAGGLDLRDVLRELPEWDQGYRAIRVLRDNMPLPDAPPDLGDRIAPTVYGLVHCGHPVSDQLVKVFLASVAVGYDRQRSLLPDPVKVKPVMLGSDALIGGIRRRLGSFGEVSGRQARLMLAGEPATWHGVSPDPDSADWTWKLWFGSLLPFAVETGLEYLAALEELIGGRPEPQPSWVPVEPSALPRALDHLDLAWLVRAKQRLFHRPAFARTASLTQTANSAEEFEVRCNALSDVFSMLTVPKADNVEGPLNCLKAALGQHLDDPGRLRRAVEAVDVVRDVVALRRGQAHSGAASESRKAAARLGIRLTGDWAESWDRVRQVTIEAIYALIDELEAG